MGSMATETGPVTPPLKGTRENPAREPRKRPLAGKGSIGDVAFRDALVIVIAAWLLLFLLAYSLRHHNI